MKKYQVEFERISPFKASPSFPLTKTIEAYAESEELAASIAKEKLTEYMGNVIDKYGRHASRSMEYAKYEIRSISISTKEEKFNPDVKSFGTKQKYVKSPFCPTEILDKFAKEELKLHREILNHENTNDKTKLEILLSLSASDNRIDRVIAAKHDLLPLDILEDLCNDRDRYVNETARKSRDRQLS
jgi:hypothetical protein